MDMRIGVQCYTIRDFCQTIEDFDASCKKVSDMGYKTLQISGTGDFTADEVKSVIDKYNMEVVCTHREPEDLIDNLDKEIEFHKTIGCDICGIGMLPRRVMTEEAVNSYIKDFKPIVKELGNAGLYFGYHNHAFEFQKINGRFAFDIMAEAFDMDNYKYTLDVYWLAVAGIDPGKFIRKNKGRIGCVHFKDLVIELITPKYAEIGVGNLDWDDIIEACKEAGAMCAVVEQDICERNPFDCLKTSYDFLKTKGFC